MRLKLDRALKRATENLLRLQKPDGSWVGEVELNPGPTAQVVMLHAAVGREFPQGLAMKAQNYLLRTQNPDGGWSPHGGASSEVSLTCECYIALRLLGCESDSLARARQCIGQLGGPAKANPWTQLYLATLGILSWELIYKTPIEIMLLPRFLPLQLRDMSYWVKTITVPMALLGEVGPGRAIAQAEVLREELNVRDEDFRSLWNHPAVQFLKALSHRVPFKREKFKAVAVQRAWEWVEDFTEAHGDFGGNTCTALNVLLALDRTGQKQSQKFTAGYQALMSYAIETEAEWRMQCCQSHIWDTGFALSALSQGHAPVASVEWLKERQILEVSGDWSRNVKAAPGGWCFGNRHDHFPVTDCTALAFLGCARHDRTYLQSESAKRAVKWLLAMQHEAGGWSAYEKYRSGQWLNRVVKFKDLDNALVDGPKADVSAKVLEALAHARTAFPEIESALQKGRSYLMSARNERGLWRGNYGINYIYGTAFAAKALREIDGQASEDWADSVREFFLEAQNLDGGWGECEDSYRDPSAIGFGSSGPVQTAWALMGLAAASRGSEREISALRRGAEFLLKTQKPDGSWQESQFLGTVFPGMVYFRYELYPAYFPLQALRAVRAALADEARESKPSRSPQLELHV